MFTGNEQGTGFRFLRCLNKTIIATRRNSGTATPLTHMSKTSKALKKQAVTSQLAAQRTTDPAVARQLTTLAEAFRAQAAALKKKHKKKK